MSNYKLMPVKPTPEMEGDCIINNFIILDGMAFSKTEILEQRIALCDALDTAEKLTTERDALQTECEKLVEALEEISDPIRFMRKRLEEGEQLNGMAAIQLAEDASYLRGIARAALTTYRKGGDQ